MKMIAIICGPSLLMVAIIYVRYKKCLPYILSDRWFQFYQSISNSDCFRQCLTHRFDPLMNQLEPFCHRLLCPYRLLLLFCFQLIQLIYIQVFLNQKFEEKHLHIELEHFDRNSDNEKSDILYQQVQLESFICLKNADTRWYNVETLPRNRTISVGQL